MAIETGFTDIENVTLEHNINLICNEEGKLRNLQPNRIINNDCIVGTFFIAKQKGEKLVSLNEKEIAKYKDMFKIGDV